MIDKRASKSAPTIMEDNRRKLIILLFASVLASCFAQGYDGICPPQDLILPCRCSQKGSEIQIWCSHSDLPRVLNGIKSTSKALNRPIDELILENNFLPSLPGRAFAQLHITRLMLRHNGLERLSAGWLNDMEVNLVEIFIVEPGLRSIPVDSLLGIRNLEAITIQSNGLKRSPEFSGLPKLRYINIESESMIELSPRGFQNLLNVESISITHSKSLTRLEAGLLIDLPKLKSVNLNDNGIEWIHLRTFSSGLMSLQLIDLSDNRLSNAGMVGRAIKDLPNLETLNLNHNFFEVLSEASFVDLPRLKELRLNDNQIQELHHGAFHRVPSLKIVHLENNRLRHVHPESFLMSSGRGIETIHLQHNDIARIAEVRSILDALPTLRYLDLSYNQLTEIPFGALRGHGTLEQLHLNNNYLRLIERDALMALPSLRELRLRNNSLTDLLPMPFWNLPALKGLDISFNKFRRLEPIFLTGLPSIRRFDISENALSYIDQNVFSHTPMLETVNISSNELNTIDRNTFGHLTNLYELDVSSNNLIEMVTGLPRAIERVNLKNNKIQNLATTPGSFELPNLRMVDLSNNNLARVHQVFSRSPQLRALNLARNKLTTVEETNFLGLNRLEVLNLQDNQINSMHEFSTAAMSSLTELNLQGNRLEIFADTILDNTPNIERLDLSRNNIVEIMPNSFRKTRSLQNLDLSGNALKQLPESLENLTNLKDIDVSFNTIQSLEPTIMQSWRNLEEFRASNNKIQELSQGTFKNLPLLQYLDISSNDIAAIERGAIRNLPELQEIVLADNRLIELRDRIFEDLPNLQAVHLQQNNLRIVAPNTFYNSPSVLYLNLSTNQFRHMENINLRNARNLEVLDLSNNEIRRVSASPLRGLDWLVELKLNDNRICKIQGEPFSAMPRLRVLNLRNNRMGRLREGNFRSLRSNIAILDVDGNPIDCSCDMLWLRAWLQETNSQAGPACRDGTMLRDLDLNRQNCNLNLPDDQGLNKIPLTNEHGDLFLRSNDYDDCGPLSSEGGYEDFPPHQQFYNNNQRPSPIESDYFYDQYVDYPLNDTVNNTLNSTGGRFNQTSPFVDFNQNKFTQNQQVPPVFRPPVGPQFTFFGRPLPGLSLGNVWGAGRSANTRATSGENTTRGKGRVQIFRPGDPELQVIVNRPTNELEPVDLKNREPAASSKNPVVDSSLEKMDEKFYRPYPYFQTPFSQPKDKGFPQPKPDQSFPQSRPEIYTSMNRPETYPPLNRPEVYSPIRPEILPKSRPEPGLPQPRPEKGGFSPMIPGIIGGFVPVEIPMKNDTRDYPGMRDWPQDDTFKEVQLVTKSESQTKRTSSVSAVGLVDKIGNEKNGQTTLSHLTTSLSPILSTLGPKLERVTEKPNMDGPESEEDFDEESREVESRMPNKFDRIRFEEEVRQETERTSTPGFPSTTEGNTQSTNRFASPPMSTTTESEIIVSDSVEAFDENNENFNESSSLSADHLIAPGSIISQDIPPVVKPPVLPGIVTKAGKITKVFTPPPPVHTSSEITKLLKPFQPQQYSSEPPTGFDNEFQPNQIYQQTFNDPDHQSESPQYEREDMDWYYNNYNQSQSNHPILNYNSQPYDHERSSASRRSCQLATSALFLIVIRILAL